MKSPEKTFIRGPSPSYSDGAASDNGMPFSLPIATAAMDIGPEQCSADNFLEEKFNGYGTPSYIKQHGRHTFTFWSIVAILLTLTVVNLILTLIIIGVLQLGKGIHGMELIPEEGVIKFYGSTDLDRIYSKAFGQIEGFTDVPVSITGEESSVFVRLLRNGQAHNRFVMDKTGIQFRAINTFEIKDPKSGATIFTTHRPHYNMPTGADILIAKGTSASRVSSPIGQPLAIEADGRVFIKGAEGISLDASSVLFQSEHNISINSTEIVLEAGSGIFLDMDKVPISSSEFGLRTGSVQYKICICMPQGTLFRIAIPRLHNGPKISCAHFSSKHDPCGF